VSDAPAAIPARLLDPRQMRLAAGVTEAQAARLVQRSVATIRRWESGIPHGRPWGRIPEMLARRLQAHYQKQLNQRGTERSGLSPGNLFGQAQRNRARPSNRGSLARGPVERGESAPPRRQ
jgi:transcriptional regulator with XRE-family HTH domain